MSKYKNHKVTHDGMTFDSKKECELLKRELARYFVLVN